MKFIGKYGEYLVLLNLLQRGIEGYLAIKDNQDDYDITVILNDSCVKRIQVKSTNLQSKTTNNSIKGVEKKYDYLVLIIVDNGVDNIFILTKEEVLNEKGNNKNLSCSEKVSGKYSIKNNFLKYQNKWKKIKK